MNINMELLLQTFQLMGQGMLGIFVVIGLIFLLVVLLTKATAGQKEEKEER